MKIVKYVTFILLPFGLLSQGINPELNDLWTVNLNAGTFAAVEMA